jgi:hypothetical protein
MRKEIKLTLVIIEKYLLSTTYKILLKILLSKLIPSIDKIIHDIPHRWRKRGIKYCST